MLRQRPDLKANAERAPRHWVFLAENSADHNEVRLIEREIKRIEQATTAAADPIRLAWESVVLRRSPFAVRSMPKRGD